MLSRRNILVDLLGSGAVLALAGRGAMATAAPTVKPTFPTFGGQSVPPTLDYVRPHTKGRDTHNLFDDFGFVIRARADTGEDLHLWIFFYQQRGRDVLVDGDLNQTTLVMTRFAPDEKLRMHDTPFVNKGQNIDDYLTPGTLETVEAADSVTWTLAGRTIVAKPPFFHITGDHAGIGCDLRLRQEGPFFLQAKRIEDLGQDGQAGYIGLGSAEGTITVGGRTLRIKGYYINERWTMVGTMPSRLRYMKGNGLNWAQGWSEAFSWYIKGSSDGGRATAMLNIDGRQLIPPAPDAVRITDLEDWVDPVTRQKLARKWRFQARFAEGTLDAVVTSYGRAFYTWAREGGTMVVTQHLADAEARFTWNDGRVVATPQMAFLENMRTLYDQGDYGSLPAG